MSSVGPIRRTVHACVQCRERKTKCGGITDQATCVGCSSRKATCSFENEARDPRFNPYLRVKSREMSERPMDSHYQPSPDVQSELRQLRAEMEAMKAIRQSGQYTAPYNPSRHQRYAASAPSMDTSPPTLYPPLPSTQNLHRQSSPSDAVNADQVFDTLDPIDSCPDGREEMPLSALSDQFFGDMVEPDHWSSVDKQPILSSSAQERPGSTSTTQPSPDVPFHGPMRILQELGANDGFDLEVHDPIVRQIITLGEANIAHKTFFAHCHINAPFLDPVQDADMASVRSRSMALFLNIIVVAARFWSHKSKRDTWLHPRYTRLVALLDGEMARLTLRPRPADICLETVQAWMIYSHWMPIDVVTTSSGQSYRSRFSESSVWQCLGVAIRWATLLGLDQTAHLPFVDEGKTPTTQEIHSYRTMLYLTESDHYLALSARRPATLSPASICQALPRFLRGNWGLPTDARLASLMRVVEASYVMGSRAESEESLEAFNIDVNGIERLFLASLSDTGVHDKMSQHFPFTSLRWYRLAFASTLLPAMRSWNEAGEPLRLSVDWASQILYHLSSAATTTAFHLSPSTIEISLEPDPGLVELLSFAIDQYYVVIAYTAAFLVLAWQNGAIDNQLEINGRDRGGQGQSSTLYRLVDLASRTLRQCGPAKGHPATRYADFLTGMANLISAGSIDTAGRSNDPTQFDAGGNVWDQDWLGLWQNSGLDQDWLFGTTGDDA